MGHRREMDLAVEVPRDELGPVASNEMWDEIYDRLAELIRAHRTTLVFVNTRRLAERVAHHLAERLGEDAVLPHHGSLSRELRLDAEARLKAGELRAVVATASLELGIDIGSVDLVCQIGSPRSIAVGAAAHRPLRPLGGRDAQGAPLRHHARRAGRMRRAGARHPRRRARPPGDSPRAARHPGAADRGRLRRRGVERGRAVRAGARAPAPTARSPARDFDAVIDMLSEGIATNRGRSGAYLHRDGVNRRVRGRRGARLAAITSGGAIPDTAQLHRGRRSPKASVVGTVDEDFAVESLAGDIFLLGTTSWRIRRVGARPRARGGRARRAALHSLLARRSARPHRGAVARGLRGCATDVAGAADRRAPARRRMRPRPPRRRTGRRLRRAPARAALGVVPTVDDRRRRALLRRSRRHAARPPRALRRAHQPRLGPGAAQALLPHLQLRAAGRRHRQRHRDLARRAAQLPARGGLRVPQAGDRGATCSPRRCSMRPCSPRAGAGTPRARWPSCASRGGRKVPAAHPAHARRRPAGRGLPRPGRLRRKSRRRSAHSRSSAGERDDRRLPARGHGPRRPRRDPARHSRPAPSAPWPSTRPSPRPSRTRSSTPTRTPSSTTRRSRSAARAPSRCAARCARTWRRRRPARPRGHRAGRGRSLARGARCRRAARRAADARHRAARAGVGALLPRARRSAPRHARSTGRFWVAAERLDLARGRAPARATSRRTSPP